MRVAIMQPYFLPYLGYWQLINCVDLFIVFDIVKFKKKTWICRNRILHPNPAKEFQYINIPVKGYNSCKLIKDIKINYELNWSETILGKLSVYKMLKAKYYNQVIILLSEIFLYKFDFLVQLLIQCMISVCNYLGISFEYKLASEIKYDKELVEGPGDWALAISKSIGAKEYVNPYGGYKIFDEKKYKKNGISLKFLLPKLRRYRQSWRREFIPGLSIVDIMMFNTIDEIRFMLNFDYDLLSKSELINIFENERQH